jgi:hypothetical protein
MTEAAGGPTLRGMTARKPLLALHIISSVGLLGSTSASLMLAVTAATTDDDALAHATYELMATAGMVFGIPLSFLALISGLVLGLRGRWGVLRYRWTAIKLALNVAVIGVGALLVGPGIEARLDGGGSAWGLAAAVGANVLMLAAATVVSVFRPRRLLRRRAAPSYA